MTASGEIQEFWPAIEGVSLRKTKQFTKEFFELGTDEKMMWFDQLDTAKSWRREADEGMTLDRYLAQVTRKAFVRLVVGRKEYFADWERAASISLMLSDHFQDFPSIDKFAWCIHKHTPASYEKINGIFRKVYGTNMAEYRRLPGSR